MLSWCGTWWMLSWHIFHSASKGCSSPVLHEEILQMSIPYSMMQRKLTFASFECNGYFIGLTVALFSAEWLCCWRKGNREKDSQFTLFMYHTFYVLYLYYITYYVSILRINWTQVEWGSEISYWILCIFILSKKTLVLFAITWVRIYYLKRWKFKVRSVQGNLFLLVTFFYMSI